MNKKLSISLFLLAAIAFSGCTTTISTTTSSTSSSSTSSNTRTLNSGAFTATLEYKGNNSWSYEAVGNVPTPCHTVTSQAVIAESYPEQVRIELTVAQPKSDTVCAQVETQKIVDGMFTASENATITMIIK